MRLLLLLVIFAVSSPAAAAPRHRLIKTIYLGPKQLSMSPDGTEVWATELYIHRVAIVDTDSLKVVHRINLHGAEPVEIVHRRRAPEVWVSILNRRAVYVFDADTRRITHRIPTGPEPKGIAFTPDEKLAFVTNWRGRSVTIIDVGTKKVLRTVRVGRIPRGVVVTPDGREAWVAGFKGRDIHIIDTRSLEVIDVIRGLARDPRHLVISPDGRTAFLSCNRGGVVQVIDVPTRKVRATIKTGAGGRSIILAHGGRYAYQANYYTRQVVVIDTHTLRIVERIPAMKQCIAMAITPDGKRLFVSNYNSWRVQVFAVPSRYRQPPPSQHARRPLPPAGVLPATAAGSTKAARPL